jgi:hypothetical protein
MSTKRITKKLRQAALILGDEQFADDDEFIINLYKRGKVTQKQIYAALHHFGYRWRAGRWYLAWPRWLKTALNARDDEIIESWQLDPANEMKYKVMARVTRKAR